MKRSTFISMLTLLIPLAGVGQSQNALLDDIYFKPSNATKIEKTQVEKKKPTYKNGAREIVYIDRQQNEKPVSNDTSYVLAQANDSIIYNSDDSVQNGYYLNGFKGTKSDYEYAERIRRFHNPKYTIFIGDPRYNDIYFLNDNDWNVYLDGSYAYVTPTWTNPYWNNYYFNPYSYGGWGGWNSPYGYGGWNNYPWGGYNNFYGYGGFGGYYGGYGYGGYYGYGYPYYGYGGYGYGGYWGGGYGYGGNKDNRKGSTTSLSGRIGGIGGGGNQTINRQSVIGGSSNYGSSSRNPYTVVSGSGSGIINQSTGSRMASSRTTNIPTQATQRNYQGTGNGIGLVRTSTTRNTNGLYQNYNNSSNTGTTRIFTNSGTTVINTRPRTATITTYSNPNSNVGVSRSNYSSGSSNYGNTVNRQSSNYNSGRRSTTTDTPTYNSGSRSSSISTPSNNSSSTYSSPSYSSPSYSSGSSGGSSSGGSSSRSSGGSSSSGGGGGRR